VRADLAPIRERVDRANGDLNRLLTDIAAFFREHGDPIGLGLKADRAPNAIAVFVMSVASSESGDWDRRLAHILYDCRSSLDHLVRQLHIASTRREPSGRIARRLQLPICVRRATWRESLRGHRLDGLASDYVDIIEQHQPYKMRRYTTHALTLLDRLLERDKHQEPLVMLFGSSRFRVAADPIAGSCIVTGVDQVHNLARPIRHGVQLARIHVRPTGRGRPGVTVHCEGTMFPAFADSGAEVETTMRAIVTETSNLLRRFETRPEFARPQPRPPIRGKGSDAVAMMRGPAPRAQLRLR
jgi:hypothetical protein